jgi:SAM-dependent methyltransferase
VREELAARQLDEQITARFAVGKRLRVLDVGPGHGPRTLRLARAGHLVTALESDPGMLAALRETIDGEPEGIRERVLVVEGDGRETGRHFGPGSFDVVLCHGAPMDAPEPDAMLAALARVLASGGLLSLLVRNGDALAMRPALLGDWTGTLAAFGADPGRYRRETLAATLTGIGVPLRAWYGVRVFTQGGEGDGDGAVSEELLSAELLAGRTDPYRAVAGLLHLCGVRD